MRSRSALCGFFAAAVTFATVSAGADTDGASGEIEEVVVVAHKMARPLRSVAATVSVVTRASLDGQMATALADVFRYVPGIGDVSAGSRFGTEGVNIRGIGGNRVALVLDGVPLAHQFSIGRFSNATRDFIDAGLIERVEVLHGPASALYGSAAIGGVVVVQTPRPSQVPGASAFRGSARLMHDSRDDSEHLRTLLAAGTDKLGLVAGISVRDGHQSEVAQPPPLVDTKDYRRDAGLLNILASDEHGRALRVGLIHQSSHTTSQQRSMLGQGRFRSTTELAGDDDYRLNLASIELDLARDDGFFDQAIARAFVEQVDVRQDTLDVRARASRPVRIERQFHFRQDIKGAELNLQRGVSTGALDHRLGLGLQWGSYRTNEMRDGTELGLNDGVLSTTVLGEVFPVRDFPISTTHETGLYVEDTISVGRLTVIGAVRADHYHLTPDTDAIFREDNPLSQPVELSQTSVSPKVGVIVRVAPTVDLYAQYAHGFRAPPFEDANIGFDLPLFNYRAIPNPDLRAETSDGVEMGVRWSGPGTRGHVGAFLTRYRDFIESKVRLGIDPVSGALIFQSRNISDASIHGVEANWRAQLPGVMRDLDVELAAFWAQGEDDTSGQYLNSVGPAQAVAAVNWSAPSAATHASLRGTFTRRWSHRNTARGDLFTPPGYAVFDAYVQHQWGARTTLSAGIRNLTDRVYWRWSDVGGLAPDDPSLPVLAGAGRHYSLGFDVRW